MSFLSLALVSIAVVAAIAVTCEFSAPAFLISVALVLVGFFTIKKDADSPRTPYGLGAMIIVVGYFLNQFIKTSAPFPLNLVYLLLMLLLAYCGWRIWADYKSEDA